MVSRAIQSSSSRVKISLTLVLKTSEILMASAVEGMYRSASMELIV
jgi:hypothetical protein